MSLHYARGHKASLNTPDAFLFSARHTFVLYQGRVYEGFPLLAIGYMSAGSLFIFPSTMLMYIRVMLFYACGHKITSPWPAFLLFLQQALFLR